MGKYVFYGDLTHINSSMRMFFWSTTSWLGCNNPQAWNAEAEETLSNELVHAAPEGNIDMVTSLLDRGQMSTRWINDGINPLGFSVGGGRAPATHALAARGANAVTMRNFDGDFYWK
jgi:hypothetical protein